MPRNPELNLLHEQAQRAFEAKQAKFAELKIAREQAMPRMQVCSLLEMSMIRLFLR